MHARVNRTETPPEGIDVAARQFEDIVLPLLRGLDGYRGCLCLADRSTGTQIAISCWESEEAMLGSEEAVAQLRKDVASAAGARSETIVERFEVIIQDQ